MGASRKSSKDRVTRICDECELPFADHKHSDSKECRTCVRSRTVPNPTPEEIRAECLAIQETWGKLELRRRTVCKPHYFRFDVATSTGN